MDEDSTTVIAQRIDQCQVSNVVIYRDRAEVNRLSTISSGEAGMVELRLTGLVETADPESIRVRAEIGCCEIVEVSSTVHHSAVDTEDLGPEAEARAALEEKRDQLCACESDLQRIQQRDNLVQGYMAKMLTFASSTPAAAAAAVNLPSVNTDQVKELLTFHTTAGAQTDADLRSAQKQVTQCEREMRAAEKAYRDVSSGSKSGTKSSRDISIILNIAEKDDITLRVTYNVSKAR